MINHEHKLYKEDLEYGYYRLHPIIKFTQKRIHILEATREILLKLGFKNPRLTTDYTYNPRRTKRSIIHHLILSSSDDVIMFSEIIPVQHPERAPKLRLMAKLLKKKTSKNVVKLLLTILERHPEVVEDIP